MPALTVDADLVAAYLNRLYEIGRLPGGGVWRGAYSSAWDEARQVVRGWLGDAGLAVREDAVGNLYGRLEGVRPAPVVLVGSHIDSVYAGGKFDGPLGVVGAIAAARALQDRHPRPARTVEVFVSCEEEDSRFICDFWGGRAVVGTIAPGEADRYRDADGISLAEAMRAHGLDPDRAGEARRDDIAAFLELHIEQGPVLDRVGVGLGMVEAICGVSRIAVRARGRADHAGSTPLALRADALAVAAEIILAARAEALRQGEPARATVGALTVRPNQPNIVAETADFIIDVRHPDRAGQEGLLATMRALCQAAGAANGAVTVETTVLVDQPPTTMDGALLTLLDRLADQRGWRHQRMVSGPGHDSMILGRRFPTAMIFVPSRDGRSHSPAEFTPHDQLMPGVQLLADAVEALATAADRP